MRDKLTTQQGEIPRVEFLSIGVGTMRSSTSYIVLLLNLEDPDFRAAIVASAMGALGIKLEDVADELDGTMCPKCHLDLAARCRRRGSCV